MAQIQWYPGHMAKAKREISENIKLVDFVVEVRDARVPQASENPLLKEIIQDKRRIIVLSKSDKADSNETKKWVSKFKEEGAYALDLNLINNKQVSNIITNAAKTICADKINRLKAKGLKTVNLKGMVVGIPNVGKSTLINSLSNRKVAKTADHPGVTKNLSWIKVSPEVSLLDTPGVLWPKFEDKQVGYLLAVSGAIKDDILPLNEVVEFAISYLLKKHPEKLIEKYNIELGDVQQSLKMIANSRGCLNNDGNIDDLRLYKMILKDIRDNQISNVTWECVNED